MPYMNLWPDGETPRMQRLAIQFTLAYDLVVTPVALSYVQVAPE